jgi:AcrR family transcriptional regulator
MNETDKIWKIVNAILGLEVSRGHLKWKVSEVARAAKISRTLIYYHLGRSKKQIVENCLERVAGEFYGLSDERMRLVREGRLYECVRQSQQLYQKYPEFMIFYSRWRMRKSPLQALLIDIEERYRKKLTELFPALEREEIFALHALMQGLVSAPFITPATFDTALAMMQPVLARSALPRLQKQLNCLRTCPPNTSEVL